MTDPRNGGGISALLSSAGEARREEILGRLESAQAWRRRRRHAARAAAISAPILVLAIVVAQLRPHSAPTPGPIADSNPAGPWSVPSTLEMTEQTLAAAPRSAARIEMVATDPGILDRLALKTAAVPAETYIGDDELMALMAEAGEPTGLIRARGRVILSADLGRSREVQPGPGSRGPETLPPDRG